MQDSPRRQLWAPMIHSLISRRDTGDAGVTSKNHRSSRFIRRNVPEGTMGSTSRIHQAPRARAYLGRAPEWSPGRSPSEQKQRLLCPAELFQTYCFSRTPAKRAPGPELDSRDPREPPHSGLPPPSVSPISQMRGQERLRDVPRATQQILDSEPGHTPKPTPFHSTVFTSCWRTAVAGSQALQTPGDDGKPVLDRSSPTNGAPSYAKRALLGCQAEAEAPRAGRRLPSQETPSGSSW